MHCMPSTVRTAATLCQGIVYIQCTLLSALGKKGMHSPHCRHTVLFYSGSTVRATTHCTPTALRAGMVHTGKRQNKAILFKTFQKRKMLSFSTALWYTCTYITASGNADPWNRLGEKHCNIQIYVILTKNFHHL